MNLEELRIARVAAERAIAKSVQSLLDEFHELTGAPIESVSISTTDWTTTGRPPKTVVTGVEVRIKV